MAQRTWLDAIRHKRRTKTARAVMFLAGAAGLWLSVSGLGVWVWVAVFHHLPPGAISWRWLCGVGAVTALPLAAVAPLAPMKGPDPEVIAADEFFHGPPR